MNMRFLRKSLLVVALCCFGCADSEDGVALTFWAMGAEGENVKPLIEQFERENPGIRVRVQAIPWGAAYEKLLTAYAGQALPDVCQLGNTWIPQFAMLNALKPLDSLIERSSTVAAGNFFSGIWETNRVNEQVFGVPWYVDTRLLFYRSDIFEAAGLQKPPATWDEWLAASRLISNGDGRYANFFSLIFNDWHVPVILILSNGGKMLRDNNCYGAFDDPKTVEALQFYVQFFQENLAPRSMTEFVNVYQGFTSGKLATWITGPWNVHQLRERSPELSGKWSTAPMPRQQSRSSTAGGASLVLFKNSKYPAEAWRFVEFLSLRSTQEKFFQLTRDLPAVKSAWEAPELKNDREIHAFFEQLQSVEATPPIAEWEQIAVKIQEYMEKVVYHQITLDAAIVKLNQEVDRILAKRRWLMQKNLLYIEED